MTAGELIECLRAQANPANVEGMARYGISRIGTLGVSMPEVRRLAKLAGHDHALAMELWDSGIHEARILATLVAEPARLTEAGMNRWACAFDSWDVCDVACQNAFRYSPLAFYMIERWADAQEEFVRRAAFSLIAGLAVKSPAGDARFLALFPLIEKAATDDRPMVRKAVNWALRGIGKRNAALHEEAIRLAGRIRVMDSKAARWIAADALRELRSPAVIRRIEERERTGRGRARQPLRQQPG